MVVGEFGVCVWDLVPVPIQIKIDWINVIWIGSWQAFTLHREIFLIGKDKALK
jgi:hypothetical protein